MEFLPVQDKLNVYWLGQAGFVFVSPSGQTLCVDPYLSDCCEREFGFKRLMPHIITAEKMRTNYLFTTHVHHDHFDPDSIPVIAQNGKTKVYCCNDAVDECKELGVTNVTFFKLGDVIECGDFTVEAVRCDHGELAPLAVGLLIRACGKKVYIMGDTAYRPEFYKDEKLQNADLLIAPINGAFGNLDSETAAMAAQDLDPAVTVPCHFWNFAEHLGDPASFMEEMKKRNLKYELLAMAGNISI